MSRNSTEALADQKATTTRKNDSSQDGQEDVSELPDAPGTDEDPAELELTKDTVFELLKNQRRRYVLRYLQEQGSPAKLNELAEQVAAWENDKDIDLITSGERKRAYVGLYQCHLTKMDEENVINFNQSRGTIELTEAAEQLYGFLDSDDDADEEIEASPTPWARYYVALAALGGVIVAGAGVGTTVGTGGLALAAALVVAFGALAVVHGVRDGSFVLGRSAGEDENETEHSE